MEVTKEVVRVVRLKQRQLRCLLRLDQRDHLGAAAPVRLAVQAALAAGLLPEPVHQLAQRRQPGIVSRRKCMPVPDGRRIPAAARVCGITRAHRPVAIRRLHQREFRLASAGEQRPLVSGIREYAAVVDTARLRRHAP